MKASAEAYLRTMTPYRADNVVAGEWILTWSWRADLCARMGIPCGLGPARSMPHGMCMGSAWSAHAERLISQRR
jgi:hypothetical protein